MKILISGAGIAGPTLAYWLKRHGMAPVLLEHAPALRSGGYVIDFWGRGYDIAEKMGLLPGLSAAGYRMQELRIVDRRGARVAAFGTRVFAELTGGRYISVGRSDLARLIFDQVRDTCETLFGDTIVKLTPDAGGVDVVLAHGGERRFDLVVGADGLHSNVRRLAFGPQERCETDLGYGVAAFETTGYRPRDEGVYVLHGAPGRQIARFALHQDRTLFLFIFAGRSDPAPGLAAQKTLLKEKFADVGWECPRILEALEACEDLYFDRVSQIRLDRWSRGRLVLVGDAASCISLVGGQGSALAMTQAYVLAGELATARGRFEDAFARYEALLRPYLRAKQKAATRFAGAFAPRTTFGIWLRNAVITAFAIPGLARFSFGRDLADQLTLPQYDPFSQPP